MKYLKVWQKLALLNAIFIVLLAIVTYQLIASVNRLGVEFAELEKKGVEYYDPLIKVMKDVQRHRSAAAAVLSGDASARDTLAARNTELNADLKILDEVDQRLNVALHLTDKWTPLRAAIIGLVNKTPSLTPEESFKQHTDIVGQLVDLITADGDASKLTLDPDLDSYYLMDVVIFQAPVLSENVSQANALGASAVARNFVTPEQLSKLNDLGVLASYLRGQVDESFQKSFETNASLKPDLDAPTQTSSAAVQTALGYIRNLVALGKIDASSAGYRANMTQCLDKVLDMELKANQSLNTLLDKRIEGFNHDLNQTLVKAGIGLLLVCLVGYLIMRDITAPLQEVVAIANQISTGDLHVQITSKERRDEVGTLARAFDRMITMFREIVSVAEQIAAGNLALKVSPRSQHDVMGQSFATMIEQLSALVGQVQKSGIQVNTSVTEIAATAKQQQATASEIAATTTEVSATSRQISATSKELVKTMDQVSTVAEQSATMAGHGQAGLSRMEETMRHVMEAAGSINAKLAVLNEKAGNINQVVTTITKVADQTNLLSLNAAIEAEKAGEYGRGFAVVATEIRRLADQTAVATYDIEQMIKEIQSAVSAGVMGMDKFSEEVRRGMNEVQQVGAQLTQIIQDVQALAPRFETVNEGMQAQATGAEQITEALTQLSEAAQQTVESLRQSNQVIDGLNQASVGLRSGVSRFKLEG